MRHKHNNIRLKDVDKPDPDSEDGWTTIYKAVVHPYHRREVQLARAGGRDIQSKITWWCEYYASV